MSPKGGVVFGFGRFELDIDNAELRRDGQAVKLAPQPFKALYLLLSRAGTLVTREELNAALWGDKNFVDFSAGLNFCMAQLRAVLDDPAAQPSYIATIPRRGYKFVAPVEVRRVAEAIAASAASTSSVPAARGTRVGSWIATGAIAVAVALTQVSGRASGEPRTGSSVLAALESFDRGALGLADAGPAELPSRIALFAAAINLDAGFAAAYAGLADARLMSGNYRAEAPSSAYAAAKANAGKALELVPTLSYAHAVYGAAVLYFEWDWKTAGDHLRRAVSLDPNSPRPHQWFSRYLSAIGEHDAALREARLAVSLAPVSASARTDLGMALFRAGRNEEAIAVCDEAIGFLPGFLPARLCVSAAASELGAFRVALSQTAEILKAGGASRERIDGLAETGSDPLIFWRARLQRLQADLPDAECGCLAFHLAVPLAHLGETDRALAWLERAAELRDDGLIFAGVHPAFSAIRSHPRFVRLLQRVGLPIVSRR